MHEKDILCYDDTFYKFYLTKIMLDLSPYHPKAQLFLWIPGINLLITAGTFTAFPAAVLIHSIGCTILTLFSVFDSYSLLINNLPPDDSDQKFYIHVILGGLCITSAIFQCLVGLVGFLSNIFGVKSIDVLMIKRFHMIFGLVLTILMKIQIYHFLNAKDRPLWLIIDIVTILFYLYVKFTREKLTSSETQPQKPALPAINSLSTIAKPDSVFCAFKNYIYDLSSLRTWHPAGFQILESVKNGDVEKYLYGVYAAEKIAGINKHTHSNHSINLFEEPVAKLQIASSFVGLAAENVAIIAQMRRVASNVYELHLKVPNSALQFTGYTDVKQLGRFYALTINKQTTRLYTIVNLFHWRNVHFLQQHLKETSALQQYYQGRLCRFEAVPLLLKYYRGGQFTGPLVESANPELCLSQQLGLGFQLDQVIAGEIFIIAGGTGIYPFLDLLDLIYKKHLLSLKPHLANDILSMSPLLRSGLLDKFTFTVYSALQSLQELHPLVLQMLRELSACRQIKVSLKVKSPDAPSFPELSFTSQRIEDFAEEAFARQTVSKFLVCGPQKMNNLVAALLAAHQVNPERYLIL